MSCALAGGLCRHRGPPFRPVPLSRPACRRRRAAGPRLPARMPRPSPSSTSKATKASLERVHDAGLFAGRLSNGSRRYRVRARFGERQVEIEDPYRFPPILSDFDLYLLGEGHAPASLRQARRAPDGARRRRGRRLRGVRAERPAGQRGRRFQSLGRPPPRHARARQRLLGNLRARRARRRQIQVRDHRAATAACCR